MDKLSKLSFLNSSFCSMLFDLHLNARFLPRRDLRRLIRKNVLKPWLGQGKKVVRAFVGSDMILVESIVSEEYSDRLGILNNLYTSEEFEKLILARRKELGLDNVSSSQ
ncbi:MAG: hypothetical protein LBT30_04870 [Clostridiales bacterium]|jgi:hypothetical protein|nr:hypothetical protein [Clostridiales bacterium]